MNETTDYLECVHPKSIFLNLDNLEGGVTGRCGNGGGGCIRLDGGRLDCCTGGLFGTGTGNVGSCFTGFRLRI